MKIAQQFRAFLEKSHYLQLPQIGRFEIVNEDSDFEKGILKKRLHFRPDNNKMADASLVSFISNYLGVEYSIAQSDLLDFVHTTRELLIQGFEAEIPGIGFLHFEQGNQLTFTGKSKYKVAAYNLKRKLAHRSASFWL
jgi:hypothetical protein